MKAIGFLPGNPVSREISREDWAGLEIAVGGDALRLAVWRTGNTSTTRGRGDVENVRVVAADAMAFFPATVPAAIPSLDSVLRAAANRAGGTLTQAEAVKIARDAGIFSTRDEVRNALEKMKIKGKQGRKKIRREAA